MKKILSTIIALTFVAIVLASVAGVETPVSAGGDKVRGDMGQGSIIQEGPKPFGLDTPAGPAY